MLVGTFLAFDKHMNLVLADTEEYRRIKAKKPGEQDREHRRGIGLVIIRGDTIIHMSAEAQPSKAVKRVQESAGGGKAQAMGRGVSVAPVGAGGSGAAGPARGVGVPAMSSMLPTGKPVASQASTVPPPPAPGMGAPPGGMGVPPPGMAGAGRGMPPGIRPPMSSSHPHSMPPTPGGMPPAPGGASQPSAPGLPPGIRPPTTNQKN